MGYLKDFYLLLRIAFPNIMSFLWHLFIVDWQYQLWCANGLDCSMEPQIMCVSDQTKQLKVMDCIQRSIDINRCPLLHSLRSQHHMLDASGSCSVSLYHVHEIYFMCICSETDYISQKKLTMVHSRRNTARLGKKGSQTKRLLLISHYKYFYTGFKLKQAASHVWKRCELFRLTC